MMKLQPSFIATLRYRTTEDGGRSGYAASGYRPTIKFPFSENQTSGQQKFIGKELVYPGETVDAEITILSVDYFQGSLYEGLDFEFREGAAIIGSGIITKILDKQLERMT